MHHAARSIGARGNDVAVGDMIFYSLLAVMHAPSFISSLGVDNDDFAAVPVPGVLGQLRASEKLGRNIAELLNPFSAVEKVTTGTIARNVADIGVADNSHDRVVTAGGKTHGGKWTEEDCGTIFWDDSHGWRNVPKEIWEYSIGGFQVLSKWLGYRHERAGYAALTDDDVETVTISAVGLLRLSNCNRTVRTRMQRQSSSH